MKKAFPGVMFVCIVVSIFSLVIFRMIVSYRESEVKINNWNIEYKEGEKRCRDMGGYIESCYTKLWCTDNKGEKILFKNY